MRKSLTLFFILIHLMAHSNTEVDSVLRVLNEEISKRDYYFAKREEAIDALRHQLADTEEKEEVYHLSRELYKKYISYDYDSAYFYARKGYTLSLELDDPLHILKGKCDVIYCYLSTGLFIEAYNMLESIDKNRIPDDQWFRYYNLYGRLYSTMAEYNNQDIPLQNKYIKTAIYYIDAALETVKPNTATYDFHEAYRYFIRKDTTVEKKIEVYNSLIEKHKVQIEKNAQVASTLGKLYYMAGDTEKAIYYMALAATEDIRKAVRETTAMSTLASFLYETNNIEAASKYIYLALEDANYYNARHRKLAINSTLPFIEKDRIALIQRQKTKLSNYLLAVSILILLLSITLFIIYKQYRKLSLAKRAINDQFNQVSHMYDELEESNRVKDQQIFQALHKKSDYLHKVEVILQRLDKKLRARQYNDIHTLFKDFSLKSERDTINQSFDEAFLKLFPDFVEQYNKLLLPDSRVTLDEKGNLPPEIRIFALIRIGMNDNEQIAKFLNFSLNTIYTYKTRVKNKAVVPKDDFEAHIMRINKKKEKTDT